MPRPDGKYQYSYGSHTGVGVGFFVIEGEHVTGGDWGGVTYAGTITLNPSGSFAVSLRMNVPPGAELVMGTSAQNVTHIRDFSFELPADFEQRDPFQIQVPPAPVWLFIRPLAVDINWMADPVKLARFTRGVARLWEEGQNS